MAAADGKLYASAGAYGTATITLSTLERHVVQQEATLQVTHSEWLAVAGSVYRRMEQGGDVGVGLFVGPGLSPPSDPALAETERLAADESFVYFTSASTGLHRFPVLDPGPIEQISGYPYDATSFFAAGRGYVYHGQGTTITRLALPVGSGGALGAPEVFAGVSSEMGALDGHVSEARFEALGRPGESANFCHADGDLYTVEYPADGSYRLRWINLDTQTVATIIPHHCTRILTDDFADGLAGWTYENGVPGERGNRWDGFGSGQYVFFFEPGEGNAVGSGVMHRTLHVRPITAGGTRSVWDTTYSMGAQGGDVMLDFEVNVTGLGACASMSAVSSEFSLSTSDVDPDETGFVSLEGSTTRSVDVSAFEGCQVRVEVSGSHSASAEETHGLVSIDDIRLEAAVCPAP
jgi:hypothetical protein